MNFYLLRHAKAEELGAQFPIDSKRPLTAAGEKKMYCVAEGMRRLNLSFDLILTSPFVRARRTAEIVAEVFECKNFAISKHLASGANWRELVSELKLSFSENSEILLVGHEPFLSQFVSILTTGEKQLMLNFRKGGLCKIAIGELRCGQCGVMEWMLTPNQLVQMGEK